MLSTAHDVADGRLFRLVEAMERVGLAVEVIGRGDPSDGPPGADVRTRPRAGRFGRALDAVRLPLAARGRVLVTLTPDPLPAAALRRLLRRGPYVADCQEDYLALLSDRSWATGATGVVARGVARAAVALAGRADLTLVADDHVPPRQARHRLVVVNLPSGGYLPSPVDPEPAPRALYVGDVRRSRGLRTMLAAVEAAPRWQLDVVGPVSAEDQPWLDEWLSSSPAAHRVRIHGRRPPREAWALAAGAWVGLALLDPTPAFAAAIPSKVYEYFECGLPTLVTPLPRAAALVEQAGAGQVVTDAAEAARALEEYADHPELHAAHRLAALDWARRRAADPSPYDELARQVTALAVGGRSR
ncbi:MAG TPA: glycosyltransferase [Actinomycetes bacterium]